MIRIKMKDERLVELTKHFGLETEFQKDYFSFARMRRIQAKNLKVYGLITKK